ncbi:MAG: two-component regulator propeller domain-containing protein [Prevotella sp.]
MKSISYLVLALLWPLYVSATEQLRVTDHLLINGGLSNNYVRDICQDDYGRIWIATESGLNSFDGTLYHNYNTSNMRLGSNMINALHYDKCNGILWIGTYGNGISTLDVRTGESEHIEIPSIPIANVYDIIASPEGGFWLVGIRHLAYFDAKTKKFSLLYEAGSGMTLRYAAFDGNNHLYVTTTSSCIICYDIAKGKARIMKDALPEHTFVNDIACDNEGSMWVATRNGVFRKTNADLGFELFKPASYLEKYVYEVMPKDDDTVWLITNFGVCIENLNNGGFSMVDTHCCPINQDIVTAFCDTTGNVWLGSNGDGLYFISAAKQLFNVVSRKKTWCVCRDSEGTCWFGGEGMVFSIDASGGLKEHKISCHGKEKGYILSIEVEDERHLLLAAYDSLYRFDKLTGKVTEIVGKGGSSVNAISFFRDRDKTIWISAMDGVYRLSNGIVCKEQLLSRQLGNQMTNGVRIDRQGKIWVATYEAGVYVFDKKRKLIHRINQRNGFFANSVHHLYMDRNNRIWMSTPDGVGLIRNTDCPDSIAVFGYAQGLKDLFIRAIQEDAKGNVWVSTNNCLSMIDMNNGSVVNYGSKDGLPITNFTGGIAILHLGKLYVTSTEGICSLSLDEVGNKSYLPKLHIYQCCNFDVDNSYEPQPIRAEADGTYRVEHDQNNFRIYYCIDNLALTKRMEYSYMVKGHGNIWHPVDLNYISFREMNPGKYTIMVRARLHGQDWNDECIDEVTVVVGKPFWLKWYAFVLYSIVVLAIVVGVFVIYRRRLIEKNELAMQRIRNNEDKLRNEERIQFFTNITHELKTPISLLVGPVENLLESKTLCEDDKEKVRIIDNSSKRLHHLVDQILKFRTIESGKHDLTVEKGDIAELVSHIGNEFKAANMNSRVEFRIEMPELSMPRIYFDRDAITTIIGNLMTNASKYTFQGSITLRVEPIEADGKNLTRISVSDTGCGIPTDKITHIFNKFYQVGGKMQAEGTGIGLSIAKSLAESHKSEIKVESELGKGSVFSFELDNNETYQESLHRETDNSGVVMPIPTVDNGIPEKTKDKPIVLVVEDNTDMNNFIASSLSEDYYVIQSSNGKEGLDTALSQMPDIIVSDVMMPLMDGEEMAEILKNDLRTSHIPIVLLTAKTSIEEQAKGYESGADVYLTKPFSVKMLKTCVKNILLRQKQLLRHLEADHPKANVDDGDMQLSVIDRKFLKDLDCIIDENISSRSLSTSMLASGLKVSQTTLYRKLKVLKGLSANEYIRKRRILFAIHCMTEGRQNISEAAYNSGFNDIKHFRSCFKEEKGITPSEYIRRKTSRDV